MPLNTKKYYSIYLFFLLSTFDLPFITFTAFFVAIFLHFRKLKGLNIFVKRSTY